MKVFVSGATGFIGRATCRALIGAGHEVLALARDAGKARALETDGVRTLVGTLDDSATFVKQAGRPEAIVHLAATWFDGLETIERSNRRAASLSSAAAASRMPGAPPRAAPPATIGSWSRRRATSRKRPRTFP
jgi:uncharacterized protein YbjT (DUF2867 family)